MKTFPALLTFLLGFGIAESKAQNIELGFAVGPSMGSVRVASVPDTKYKPTASVVLGPTFSYHFSSNMAISSGLMLERKGTVVETFVNPSTTRINLDYLTLPILARYSFGNFVNWYVNAGPYVSYLIQENRIFSNSSTFAAESKNTDDFKRMDFGLSGGIGIRVPVMCNVYFNTELRHNYGLNNISALPVYKDGKLQTNSSSLMLGFTCYLR